MLSHWSPAGQPAFHNSALFAWNLWHSHIVQLLQTRACWRGRFGMAFSTAGRGPLRAEINMTPMIDILLVLIIVFMVVVSMSQQKGLDAQIPQPVTGNPPPQPERTIIIQVAWAQGNEPPS